MGKGQRIITDTLSEPESHPNYPSYAPLLSPGWLFGRKIVRSFFFFCCVSCVSFIFYNLKGAQCLTDATRGQDNSDAQYATFRGNIPYLFLVLGLHISLRHAYSLLRSRGAAADKGQAERQSSSFDGSNAPQGSNLARRMPFDVAFAVVFLIALHGFSALKIALILSANYWLAKALPRHRIPAATWLFNVVVLFANELNHGHPFAALSLGAAAAGGASAEAGWGTWMDRHGGLISRWEVFFKVTILRLISFNMDYYWSLASGGHIMVEVCPVLFLIFNF
jgi:hypothetical protein